MTSRVVTTMGPRSRLGLQNPALELFRSATSKSVRFGSHPLQFFHVGKKKKTRLADALRYSVGWAQ